MWKKPFVGQAARQWLRFKGSRSNFFRTDLSFRLAESVSSGAQSTALRKTSK